jgi:hypothetical protein
MTEKLQELDHVTEQVLAKVEKMPDTIEGMKEAIAVICTIMVYEAAKAWAAIDDPPEMAARFVCMTQLQAILLSFQTRLKALESEVQP